MNFMVPININCNILEPGYSSAAVDEIIQIQAVSICEDLLKVPFYLYF